MPVIVDCESCHTRFRLDEARIPATGAKVRCSKCKAAFIVHRPSATPDEIVEEVVAEVTNPGGSAAPATTEDLFETTGSMTMSLLGDSNTAEPEAATDEPSSDEKWEFDEAPPPLAPRPGAAEQRSAPAQQPQRAGDTDDLDSLGSPEGWDLLAGNRELAADARFEAPAAPRPEAPPARTAQRAASASAANAVPLPTWSLPESFSTPEAARPEPAQLPGWLRTVGDVAQSMINSGVWLASIALCSVGLALALSPPSEPAAESAPVPLLASLGGERLELTRHVLESAVGESHTVVRGQLPKSVPVNEQLRLRATWLDAEGHPIAGASSIAGRPLAPGELREQSLARLRAAHAAHAHELTVGGAFEAIFGPLPAAAHGIALQQERVPVPAPAATQVDVVTDATATAATASSPPTARPSSE